MPRNDLPPSLEGLSSRRGKPPHVDAHYPCPQTEESSPSAIYEALVKRARTLVGVTIRPTELSVPGGLALALDSSLAKGQPEAFIIGREFAVVREDGSIHLMLPPAWGQEVINKGWATIHPLARYMAGAIPPQTLILYAPRDETELQTILKVLDAAYWFARGEVEGRPLPDSAW